MISAYATLIELSPRLPVEESVDAWLAAHWVNDPVGLMSLFDEQPETINLDTLFDFDDEPVF